MYWPVAAPWYPASLKAGVAMATAAVDVAVADDDDDGVDDEEREEGVVNDARRHLLPILLTHSYRSYEAELTDSM